MLGFVVGKYGGQVWIVNAMPVRPSLEGEQVNVRAVVLLIAVRVVQVVVEAAEQLVRICVQKLSDVFDVDRHVNLCCPARLPQFEVLEGACVLLVESLEDLQISWKLAHEA